MKCTIPEISWHNREPVLSVDIHPVATNFYRVATGGGDSHVLIWQMIVTENGAVKQEVISDLTRHQRAVNCVRWSPSGQYLASGDDDANIIIWQLKTDNIPLLEGDTDDKEIWIVYKVLRGHKEDVYDLCWSVDGSKLFSGSVDNTAILWDMNKGKMDHILSEHKGFVQGVAWDPKNEIIATLSTDRVCRIFDTTGKQTKARISKGVLQVPKEHPLYDKEVKYFHDDTFKSFFRRLQFSPDGSLLICPSGHIDGENGKQALNGTLVFTLDNFNVPAAVLPLKKQSSTVIRCCPILFELHDYGPDPVINLPYRMIFAVGTDHDVLLYDTQQMVPFARYQDIHYTRLTDLTWSSDGLLLVASSTDGFCCLITFEQDELGVVFTENQEEVLEEGVLDISGCEELDKDENIDINNKRDSNKELSVVEAKKRPSFLEQWALKTPASKKRKIESDCKKIETSKDLDCVIVGDEPNLEKADSKDSKMVEECEVRVNVLVPKRRLKEFGVEDKMEVKESGDDVHKEETLNLKQETEEKTPANKENENRSEDKNLVTEIKNKPTFLEQWARKKAANDKKLQQKNNYDDKYNVKKTESIQNITEEALNLSDKSIEDDLTEEDEVKIKNEISNILGRPKKIENQIKDHSDAKPIAIRRKPRIQENTQKVENISEKLGNVTNRIKPEIETLTNHKKLQQRKNYDDKNSDKKTESTQNITQEALNLSDKSIEEDDLTEEDEIKIKNEISNILCRKKIENQIQDHSDAKPIAIRRKPRIQENTQKVENTSEKLGNDTESGIKPEIKPLQKDQNTHEKKANIPQKDSPLVEETVTKKIDQKSCKESISLEIEEITEKVEQKTEIHRLKNALQKEANIPLAEENATKKIDQKPRKESISLKIEEKPENEKTLKTLPIEEMKENLGIQNKNGDEASIKNDDKSQKIADKIDNSKKSPDAQKNNSKSLEKPKKRPVSLLEQWVQITPPKKKKKETKKEEKAVEIKVDIDVVEITDSPPKSEHLESKTCDSNEEETPKKIKRIVPKKIGEVSKTTTVENSAKNTKIEDSMKKSCIDKEEMTNTINAIESEAKQEKQHTKIKISSLIKKNIKKETKKQTPLCKIEKKSKFRCRVLEKPPIVGIEVDEARDSWKCLETNSKKSEDLAKKIEVVDDCTEDFTLQLEESQDNNEGNVSEEKNKINDEKIKISEDSVKINEDKIKICEEKVKVSEEKIKISEVGNILGEGKKKDTEGQNVHSEEKNKNKISAEENSTSKEKNKISEEEHGTSKEKNMISDEPSNEICSIKSFSEKGNVEKKDNLTQKVPRRVQLITISSPKGKKREK